MKTAMVTDSSLLPNDGNLKWLVQINVGALCRAIQMNVFIVDRVN